MPLLIKPDSISFETPNWLPTPYYRGSARKYFHIRKIAKLATMAPLVEGKGTLNTTQSYKIGGLLIATTFLHLIARGGWPRDSRDGMTWRRHGFRLDSRWVVAFTIYANIPTCINTAGANMSLIKSAKFIAMAMGVSIKGPSAESPCVTEPGGPRPLDASNISLRESQ